MRLTGQSNRAAVHYRILSSCHYQLKWYKWLNISDNENEKNNWQVKKKKKGKLIKWKVLFRISRKICIKITSYHLKSSIWDGVLMLLGSWLKRACWHSPERFDYNMHLTMSSANPLEGSTSSAAARQPWSPPSDNTTHSDIQHSHSPGPAASRTRYRAGTCTFSPGATLCYHATQPVPSRPHSLSGRREDPSLSLPLDHLHISFNKPFCIHLSFSAMLKEQAKLLFFFKKTEEKREGLSWFPQLAEQNATRASSIGVALTWLNSSSRVSLVMSLIPNATLHSQRQEK